MNYYRRRLEFRNVAAELGADFEEMCVTTVVTCGPPAPHPNMIHGHASWMTLGEDGLTRRNQWLLDVEDFLWSRYKLPRGSMFPRFIVALEYWWSIQKENSNGDERKEV